MAKLDAHKLTHPKPENIERATERSLTNIRAALEGGTTYRVQGFMRVASQAVGYYAPKNNRAKVQEFLRVGLDSFIAGCQLAAAPTPTAKVRLFDKEYERPTTGAVDEVHAVTWLEAFAFAQILRDAKALDTLGRMDIELFRQSPTRVEEYRNLMVLGFQSIATGDPQWKMWLDDAKQKASKSARVYKPDPPLIAVAEAFMAKDAAAFDAALQEGLVQHKKQWSSKDESAAADGLVAVPFAGWCAAALDQKIPVTADSPYLPDWLIRGDFGGT